MKVLAIDPGYDRLGVAVLSQTKGKVELHYSTCMKTDASESLPDRLLAVGQTVEKLLKEHEPDSVAIETLFFNKNITTAIGVAQARGIVIYLAKEAGCAVQEFGPQEIKVAVTGYGKSDKRAVIDMVKRLVINAPAKAEDDEYDAIAVGVTALAHHRE